MDFEKFDYKVERTENCVLVDITNWIDNPSNNLKIYHLSGKNHVNYYTKVLATNIDRGKFPEALEEGDSVILTRIVADVAKYRAHALETEKKYYDIPVMQLIGKFKNNIISLETLIPFYDKLIMEKIEPKYSKFLETPEDNSMVCRVVKAGNCRFNNKWDKVPMTVREGDIVLIRDNVTTELELDGKIYYATEESMVVGIFKENSFSLDNMKFINNNILMREHVEDRALDSILITPELDYNILDYSDIYNRNLFKVVYSDENLTKVSKNDILLINRDITNYVYFNLEKFYIISGTDYIEGKVYDGRTN